jgi:hypothetical protein
MTRYIHSVIAVLISIVVHGQISLHDEVRIMFISSWEGKCGAAELKEKLDGKDLSKSMVLLAYRGAAVSSLANCENTPWNKLKVFNSGKKEIELAVQGDPSNWEIRFVRFMVQSHIPEFLDYNHMKEDKEIVIESLCLNLQHNKSGGFYLEVTEIMLNSDLVSLTEKEKLFRLITKT